MAYFPLTGAISSVVGVDLTASRAMASDGFGKIAVATTTLTELNYSVGLTSNIQTQLDSKEVLYSSGYYKIFEEFDTGATTGQWGWISTTSGTASANSVVNTGVNATDQAAGVIQVSAGTTITARAALHLGTGNYLFGYASYDCEWRIELPILSDGTVTYTSWVGLIDNGGGGGDCTNGAYFRYDSTQSANWQMCTSNNGTQTRTATSTAVTTDWTKLRLVVNNTGTSITYYINGVSVGTITTNIPITTGRVFGLGAKVEKSVGSGGGTNRAILLDFARLAITWGTPR